jgi:hypothetical protein
VQRSNSAGLAEVLDVILDKGLVVDVFLRVSLVGIELLTVDARIVIASVDTYLRFAEAVNRLELNGQEAEGLPQLISDMQESGAAKKTKGALQGAKEKLLGSDDDASDESGSGNGGSRSSARSRRSSSSSSSRSRSHASTRGR